MLCVVRLDRRVSRPTASLTRWRELRQGEALERTPRWRQRRLGWARDASRAQAGLGAQLAYEALRSPLRAQRQHFQVFRFKR